MVRRFRCIGWCWLMIVTGWMSAPMVLAETPTGQTPTADLHSAPAIPPTNSVAPLTGGGDYVVQVLFGLMAILGLIFALVWLLKKVGQGTLIGSQHMKIVSALPLGTRERVAIVDIKGKQILLGITPTQISTLHVFDEPVVSTERPHPDSDFAGKLRAFMGSGSDKP